MLIFLYGQDTYRMQKKLNEIIESYKKAHKSGLSLKYFTEENFSLDAIANDAQMVSMFGEKKLIIFKNLLSISGNEGLLDFLKKAKTSEDINIVACEENKIKATDPSLKFLKKNAKIQEFVPLEGEKLKNWVKKEFSAYKVEVGPGIVEKLVNFVGNDLWQMSNEIKKLVSYKSSGKIEEKDVDLLVKPKIESDIFKTIDAIAQKNKRRALMLLKAHLEKGDNPLYLFSMINYQFRNLLVVKDLIERNRPYYTISKTSNLHPFVVRKSYEQAGKFSFPE
jgi:DNA polymerase III subunit delta